MRWTAEVITGLAEAAGYRDEGLQAIVARALYFSEGRDDYVSAWDLGEGSALVGLFAVPFWIDNIGNDPLHYSPAENAFQARDVLGFRLADILAGMRPGEARYTLAFAEGSRAIASGVRTMTAPDVVGVDNLPPMIRNLRQQFASVTNTIYGGIKRFRSNIDH